MHQLEKSMESSEGLELKKILAKYSELVQRYEAKGGYEAGEKLNKICKGLKFEDSFLNQDFNQLSGGEKTTVILGKILIDTPDVLLLDEPTNHLDMDSVEWLEAYIKNYKGIIIVVSHDRYFLDHTVTKIIEVEDKECETYQGNYSEYVIQKEENLRIQFNHYKEQNKKVNDLEQSIKELRDWAMRANNKKFFSRAASMQIKLDKMERVDKPVMEKQTMKMNIKAGERSGNVVISAAKLSKSFGNKTIFKEAEMLVRYGERVAFIGPNGSGKTTFLKMLLGDLPPDNGEISLGANVRMAYLPQNLAFEDEELTMLDYFRDDISILEGKAREHLAKFMFYGATVFKKIRLLSGGEKVRLKLSKLLYQDVNLLILDEPTNHLDTASIESIEEDLSGFKGTIFFISHDRYFINKVSERTIEIEDSRLVSYLGNYDYYKEMKEKRGR
jgi:ATPase subunit of ABC transporter with duplicated ATPase domains